MDWSSKLFISSFFCWYFSFLVYSETSVPTLSIEGITINDSIHKVMNYKIVNKITCNVSSEIPPNLVLKWYKDDKLFDTTDSRIEFKKNILVIRKTEESDMTSYHCALVEKEDPFKIVARSNTVHGIGKPIAKVTVMAPTSNPVDEGGKIILECVVHSKPKALIEWRKDEEKILESERIKIDDGLDQSNARLEISDVVMSDRGVYICGAMNPNLDNGTYADITVRVKDRLAALWPFIGICIEVLVLCIIIFFYERKRNKTELEESDTDQSPEQKNTPDHGKDTVRQRK